MLEALHGLFSVWSRDTGEGVYSEETHCKFWSYRHFQYSNLEKYSKERKEWFACASVWVGCEWVNKFRMTSPIKKGFIIMPSIVCCNSLGFKHPVRQNRNSKKVVKVSWPLPSRPPSTGTTNFQTFKLSRLFSNVFAFFASKFLWEKITRKWGDMFTPPSYEIRGRLCIFIAYFDPPKTIRCLRWNIFAGFYGHIFTSRFPGFVSNWARRFFTGYYLSHSDPPPGIHGCPSKQFGDSRRKGFFLFWAIFLLPFFPICS